MEILGPDFRAGLRHALYRPFNPAGLGIAIAVFIALVIVNQLILLPAFAVGISALTSGLASIQTEFLRGALLAVLPAGLLTAYLAWILARHRGVDPSEVLALRFPSLGFLGWAVILGGFPVVLYILFGVLAWLLRIDITSSGLVEQAVMQLGADPLYILVAGGLVIGAPFAEELTFRGQIFSALSQTRMGFLGASIVTSALWAAIHGFTQPLHIVGLLFVMGLALSWLLVRFGSLWVTIVCHAVWNAIQALALYWMSLP